MLYFMGFQSLESTANAKKWKSHDKYKAKELRVSGQENTKQLSNNTCKGERQQNTKQYRDKWKGKSSEGTSQ